MTDGPPTRPARLKPIGPPPLSPSARAAAERQAAEDRRAARLAADSAGAVGEPEQEQEALNAELAKVMSHPAAEAESHEPAAYLNIGASYLNMQAGAIQNQRTGRHFLFSFPKDMTTLELTEVCGWLLTGFRKELDRRHASGEATASAPPKLHIARSMPSEPKPS